MARHGTPTRRPARIALAAALVAAAGGLAACENDDTTAPRWKGSFTRAISTCGAAQTPFPIEPPLEAVVEGEGDFAAGNQVSLFVDDGCAMTGTVGADGSLLAALHPGCPAPGIAGVSVLVEDVFASETVIHQTTDHADPQTCDVEVWGTFVRE